MPTATNSGYDDFQDAECEIDADVTIKISALTEEQLEAIDLRPAMGQDAESTLTADVESALRRLTPAAPRLEETSEAMPEPVRLDLSYAVALCTAVPPSAPSAGGGSAVARAPSKVPAIAAVASRLLAVAAVAAVALAATRARVSEIVRHLTIFAAAAHRGLARLVEEVRGDRGRALYQAITQRLASLRMPSAASVPAPASSAQNMLARSLESRDVPQR